MANGSPALGFAALILTAGGILLQFFVILSGGVNRSIENKVWFLRASTNGIPNAPNPASWTFFAICGVDGNGHNVNCAKAMAALPFDPPSVKNFGTQINVPQQFIGTDKFYYMSRFMFAFFLIALFFAVIALFVGLLSLRSRIGAGLGFATVFAAFIFQAAAASLMTGWTYEGRKIFRQNGQTAMIGEYAYAFTWTPVVCFLLAMVLFCAGAGKRERGYGTSRKARRHASTKSAGSLPESQRPMAQRHSAFTFEENNERSSFERMRRSS